MKVIKPDPFKLNERKDALIAKGAMVDHHKHRKTHYKHKKATMMWRLLAIVTEIVLISAIIFFVPPVNQTFIFVLIILVTGLAYSITVFLGKKTQILSTIFVFILLVLSYFIGFDLINTILLASFIIGLSMLFKIM